MPTRFRIFIHKTTQKHSSINAHPMQETQLNPVPQPGEMETPAAGKATWQTPAVTEISRFDILSYGPTPGTTENSTFSDKSG
jgi:hypothetical protein